MLTKIVKYIVLTFIAGIILSIGGIYVGSFFASSEYTPFSKRQIEKVFGIQLPSYKVDSLWGYESFTRDLSEYQELHFDSLGQKEWLIFLAKMKECEAITQPNAHIQIIPACNIGNIMDFKGGYEFNQEEARLLIDTVLYKGYFWYMAN